MTTKNSKELKQLFPHPIACDDVGIIITSFANTYCVGGAICRSLVANPEEVQKSIAAGHIEYTFPEPSELSKQLMEINPKLSQHTATYFALEIIAYNDDAMFNDAWDAYDRAVNHTGVDL